MRPRNYRATIKELRRLCGKRGIEVLEEPDKGKGSHRGLIFRDTATGEVVPVVISGHKDISPGVQRELIKYLKSIASRVTIAEIVRIILQNLFD
jgi:predicted RNA binding protein YcfA (HicA-like mRNA interferase family)